MTTEINIITPVTRVENLPLIYKSLQNQPIKIKWWVLLDPKVHEKYNAVEKQLQSLASSADSSAEFVIIIEKSPQTNNLGGYSHRNWVMDRLSAEEWVYNLDDDTILHPALLPYLHQFDIMNRYSGIVFAQVNKNGDIRLDVKEDKIKVCHVDTGSIVYKMDIVGDLRFQEGHYVADGYFIEELYAKNKSRFTLRNIPLSYYNYIEPYIEQCPVQCLQNTNELLKMLSIYESLNPEKVLEIGSFFGGTLYYWIKRSPQLKKMISVDYPIPPSDGRYIQMLESKVKWLEWLKMAPDMKFTYFPCDSTQPETVQGVSTIIPDNDLDFIFIDGGHHYEIVKKDYENYAPLVRRGGIIAFHDIFSIEDVRRLWNEIKATGKKTLEIHDNGDGIGILYL